jgi:release factor glutamine methyltransferase
VNRSDVQDDAWTVRRLLGWTREYLAQHEIEQPRLCAEILLAHALACKKIDLYTRFDEVPAEGQRTAFRELVRRAAQQEPIAYLVGYREFFSLPFVVTPAVLIPRPETETLVQEALDRLGDGPGRVLDLGTGSGCIAVAIAHQCPGVTVVAGDISAEACEVARQNAKRHDVADRLDVRTGDLFAVLRADDRPFDLIVANPPYIGRSELDSLPANVRDYEPRVALMAGDDPLSLHKRIVAGCPEWLAPGGWLLLEVAFNQAAAVRQLLEAQPALGAVASARDGLGHERVMSAKRIEE